jgi:hypothetical protein
MNHLLALLALSAFEKRRRRAPGVYLPNAWTWGALALGLFSVIGGLSQIAYADGAPAPSSAAAFESDACQKIMGLNSSEAQYAACVETLRQSLSAAYYRNEVARETLNASWNPFQRACAEVGIRPNSRVFDRCVVDLSMSLLKLDSIPGR